MTSNSGINVIPVTLVFSSCCCCHLLPNIVPCFCTLDHQFLFFHQWHEITVFFFSLHIFWHLFLNLFYFSCLFILSPILQPILFLFLFIFVLFFLFFCSFVFKYYKIERNLVHYFVSITATMKIDQQDQSDFSLVPLHYTYFISTYLKIPCPQRATHHLGASLTQVFLHNFYTFQLSWMNTLINMKSLVPMLCGTNHSSSRLTRKHTTV